MTSKIALTSPANSSKLAPKEATSKNQESIKNLTSRTEMLEHDLQQNESIIESLNNEKKELTAKIDNVKNSGVPSNTEKI